MPAAPDDRVDVSALAAEGAVLTRRYGLDGFPRLADALAGPGGEAEARFRFQQLGADRPGCELEVTATATLRCERCLEPFVQPLRSTAQLAFVAAAGESGMLPEGHEELVVPTGQASLKELVEDELLLSLPLVAKHAAGSACAETAAQQAGSGAQAATDMRRPFAALKDLLKR